MKYDFTTIIDRHGQDSIAVDPPADSPYRAGIRLRPGLDHIPMWVADMNFPALPAIQEAIIRRAQHPTFGYFLPREEYFQRIIAWQEARSGVQGLAQEHIGHENGVLGGVVSALWVICAQGDKVLLHSPTYVGFTSVLSNNGFAAVHSPLVRDGAGVWRMDYEDMDRKLRQQNIHAAIFCSPHNPCGRVWERWEIQRAMEIFAANDVFVISDEIWADILLSGHRHIPTQSISEDARRRTMAFYAPSKTFNLAGLVGSYHIVYDPYLRHRLRKQSSLSHYNSMNVLSMHALIGAYSLEGRQWVDELCQVLTENISYACAFIRERLPGVEVMEPEGTYMLLIDCAGWLERTGRTMDELLRAGWEAGVDWQDGRDFFAPASIRLNLALPLSRVKEAFARMERYVFRAD